MNTNPYKILGVSPDATDEEIKHAYRELARKYHPDRYRDSDLADLASDKMKEVNAAYEEIQRQRTAPHEESTAGGDTYRASSGTYGGGAARDFHANDTGSFNRQQYSKEAQSKFYLIRNCINAGNITEAERLLSEIDGADRGAEWQFLFGCVAYRKGFYVDAQRAFDTAYRMEPTNNEYFRAKEEIHARAGRFGGGYQTGNGGGCCDCDLCSALLCTDCCCECMGGDFIPCC